MWHSDSLHAFSREKVSLLTTQERFWSIVHPIRIFQPFFMSGTKPILCCCKKSCTTLEPLVMFGLRVICFKMPQRNFNMCQSIKLQAFTKDISKSKALPLLAGTNSPYHKTATTQTNTIGHWNGPDVLAHSNWPTNFKLQNHHDIISISYYFMTHTM